MIIRNKIYRWILYNNDCQKIDFTTKIIDDRKLNLLDEYEKSYSRDVKLLLLIKLKVSSLKC
jgi:hypothetical protein